MKKVTTAPAGAKGPFRLYGTHYAIEKKGDGVWQVLVWNVPPAESKPEAKEKAPRKRKAT